MPQIIYRKSAASPWVKQGDRLTKTFSSGLCLIQQTYIAPKALATYNAFEEGDAITESQPCIDGAYIFPAPDYQDTGDGFMKCTVTAYGRWKTEPNVTRQKRAITLKITGTIANIVSPFPFNVPDNVTYNMSDTLNVLVDDITVFFVVPKGGDLLLSPPSSLTTMHRVTGELIPTQISIGYLQEWLGRGVTAKFKEPDTYGSGGQLAIIGQTSTLIFNIAAENDFEGDFTAKTHGISLNLTRCESVDYGQFQEYTASFQAAGESITSTPFAFTKI
jgi:hypothetical protein